MTTLLQIGLTWLLQSTALLSLGVLALWFARRGGPIVQTLIGRATLVGLALTLLLAWPLSGRVQPLWRISLPTEDRFPAFASQGTDSKTAPPMAVPPVPVRAPVAAPLSPTGTGLPSPVSATPPIPISPLLRLYAALASLWGIGTTILLIWLGVCQWHLTRLRRTAHPLTGGPAVSALAGLAEHPPRLLSHPAVQSPFLAGILRPAIFLPERAEADFSPDALRAILAHELAHLTRNDCAWMLLSRLLCAVLWPQPLLWLFCRQEVISEEACDLTVLARHCPPRAYADCLLTLAERWQPSHRERVLGAGVAPLRSAVGRRIRQILAASKPLTDTTRGFRFGVASCALLAVIGSLALLNAGADVDVPHFEWAKRQGWSVQPIQVIALDSLAGQALRLRGYSVTSQDQTLVRQCNPHPDVLYSGSPSDAGKARAEAVLAARPHFFYAEYLLSEWYQNHGETVRGAALQKTALEDAPAILAGRCSYNDGKPVIGYKFTTSIACYAADATNYKAGINLTFPDVVTDAEGCYYLPVFRGVYSQTGFAWYPDRIKHFAVVTSSTDTSEIHFDDQGSRLVKGFVANSHVGVLPPIRIMPFIILNAPFDKTTGTQQQPIPLHGTAPRISWQPYPGCAFYHIAIGEFEPDGSFVVWGQPSNTELAGPIKGTSVALPLRAGNFAFFNTLVYRLEVSGYDKKGEKISDSDSYSFRPLDGQTPQPITAQAIQQALGSEANLASIQRHGKKIMVTGTVPKTDWKDNTSPGMDRSYGASVTGWHLGPEVSPGRVAFKMIIQQ